MLRNRLLPIVAIAIATGTAGCRAEELLGQAENLWLWAVAPFVGFAFVGGTLIHLSRRRQIASWDLRQAPSEPTAQRILWWMVVTWIVLSILFAFLNFRFEIDPGQTLKNIGFWVVGSVIGAFLGLVGGLNTAEPHSYRPDPRKGV